MGSASSNLNNNDALRVDFMRKTAMLNRVDTKLTIKVAATAIGFPVFSQKEGSMWPTFDVSHSIISHYWSGPFHVLQAIVTEASRPT